jgi:hypothetical protein
VGGRVGEEGEIHQHSGWLIPLLVMAVIVVLCAALLIYYMRPFALGRNGTAPFRDSRASAAIVPLNVGGLSLRVPLRYIESGAAPTAGPRAVVALAAALPDMRGYSEDEAPLFAGNAADSPLVHLLIRARNGLGTQDRLQRVYMPYIANPMGDAGPFGLTHYAFRLQTGYGRDDLYAGNGLLLLCERPAQDLPSPNCLTIDRPIAPGVSLSYRFKRAQLSSWRVINAGVDRLVADFRK